MDGLAYDRYDDGHRRFNLKTWKDALGLEPLLERPSFRVFVRLLKSRHVLFATVDDALFLFACVSVVRALLARRTAGIFLRPHGCFRDGDMKSLFKRFIYRILVRIPFTSLATMIPHFADARYATVSHTWIYDPQNWDLVDARPDLTKRTDLVDEMIAFAGGRKIVAAIGGLNRFKGFDYLCEVAASGDWDSKSHVLIACGPLSPESHRAAEAITRSGGMVVDRFITDDDIIAIYGAAHFVWACYPPVNDQASGIFGRASQLGVPALVRAGSFNSVQAERMGAPYLAVPFGDPDRAARLIAATEISRTPPDWPLIEQFKAESVARLRDLL